MTQNVRFFHEHLERDDEGDAASPRSFGILFAIVFATIGLWPMRFGQSARLWAIAASVVFVIAALVAPAALAPLSRIWQRIGLILHHVVNPIVMGALFYGAVTPFGVVMRMLGKGLSTNLDPDPSASTYWISREGGPRSSMTNQF